MQIKKIEKLLFLKIKTKKQTIICWYCIFRCCFYVCNGSYFATISRRSFLVIDLCFLLLLLCPVLL